MRGFTGRLVYPWRPPSREGARELLRKPRPLAAIRNRHLNSIARFHYVQFRVDLAYSKFKDEGTITLRMLLPAWYQHLTAHALGHRGWR